MEYALHLSSKVNKRCQVFFTNAARSADWIATEYNNQNSPSTFLSFGSVSGGSVYDSYNYNFKNQLYQTNTGAYFGYDAAGQRVRATLGGVTTLTPTKEYSLEGATPVKYVYGNGVLVATIKDTGANAIVHYVHTDHLGGSNVVTSSSGAQEELLDYYPYGGQRLDEKTGSFGERHKYIGQFYDSDTGLNYLNARYYNAGIGKFTSEDPMFWVMPQRYLEDPQEQNSYAYARNNPIVLSDPGGLLNIIIPGTYYDEKAWVSSNANPLHENVSKTFGGTTWVYNDKSKWSGADNDSARNVGASNLKRDIGDYSFASGEQLNVIGHSHGGNVGYALSQILDRKIDTLVTLGTPVTSDYKPNYTNIGTHINVYSGDDKVQNHGGDSQSISGILGRTLFGKIGGKIGNFLGYGEFGKADRTLGGAVNIGVSDKTSWRPFKSHSQLWSRQDIWNKVKDSIGK